eukprot:361497-Chlamydomonas_euryale.AAC.10
MSPGPLLRPSNRNLDKSIDNKALHDTFSAFGRILSCKVATDVSGQSRGFGFVHFETEDAANLAIDKVNGMMIEDKIVYVGRFQKRSERPQGKEVFCNVYLKVSMWCMCVGCDLPAYACVH